MAFRYLPGTIKYLRPHYQLFDEKIPSVYHQLTDDR